MKAPIKIGENIVKNRIMMPPMVCFNWADEKGFDLGRRVLHYGKRAKNQVGLIVVEATAVCPAGRLTKGQLGLWSDEHIAQFQSIAEACHAYGSVVLVQLVHAGLKGCEEISCGPTCPSGPEAHGKALSLEEIEKVKEDFLKASQRAQKAGLDGVEIHGAHGYLLNQFTALAKNKRTDSYGGNLENRLRLSVEIVKSVREALPRPFILGYRFGVNDPTLSEDAYFAKVLEREGVDILSVSSGMGAEDFKAPEGFCFSPITAMGVEIKKQVHIPVASVYGILEPAQAKALLDGDQTDMVAVGRALLADEAWVLKALTGNAVDRCHHCKPRCKYTIDGDLCPWHLKRKALK